MLTSLEEIFALVLGLPATACGDALTKGQVEAWTSLVHLELIAALQESFRVTLTTSEILRLKSVRDARQILRAKGVAL